MEDGLDCFVASLAIPADRKAVVLAELSDHVACAREAAMRAGRDPDAAARAALGDLAALRRTLEAIEPAFRVTRGSAIARGIVAGVLVAVVIDQLGWVMFGVLGATAAVAIALVLAPPRAFELLRAELRAPRIAGALPGARGVPIGPALAYAVTVMSAPFVVWIGAIVWRGFAAGVTRVDIPWSAFALMGAVFLVLLVEGVRGAKQPA
jgi:hypothetical protein